MCHFLHLSESGCYRWLRKRDKHQVKEILVEHPDSCNYGVDRSRITLEQAGIDVSRQTVYHVMKENG